MAAPDMTAMRVGQVNGSGDAKSMFLISWSGEVLTAFEEANVMLNRHTVRTISEGKSAKFPATWKVDASYHTPGTMIVGQASNVAERTIAIDDLLVAPVFIPSIDEAMNHFDYRSIYSTECGRALAKQWDKNALQVAVLAARASATITGGNGGSSLTHADYDTVSATILAGVWSAAQAMDEKDVPEKDRFAIFRPAQYYLLAQNTTILNRDYGVTNGSHDKGGKLMVNDIEIVKSNHLPSTNVASGPSAYQGDFTNTFGLIMHKQAVGTVKLMDLMTESDYLVTHQGTLIVSKYAIGHGITRPECAVELKVA